VKFSKNSQDSKTHRKIKYDKYQTTRLVAANNCIAFWIVCLFFYCRFDPTPSSIFKFRSPN